MKWVPLVVKTSDRISSSSLEETPMDRSSFVFELGSKLCLFILFLQTIPWGLPRNTRSPLIWRKVAPGRRVTRLPELPRASQHFLHFLTETWRLITLKNKWWTPQEPFFDGNVTSLAKSTFLQENTWLAKTGQLGLKARESDHARALFSALGLRKGVNRFSYKHFLKLTRAGRVTPRKFFSI